jgi:hypothetical protein
MLDNVQKRIIWDLYERQYPGCQDKITKIFGHLPSTPEISAWKATWSGNQDNRVWFNKVAVLRDVCADLNIHPFFYQYIESEPGLPGPSVVFYSGQEAVMFKIKVSTINDSPSK